MILRENDVINLPGSSELRLLGMRDELFREASYPKPFEFNAEVVNVFDDMVQRSIPLYSAVTECAAEWACNYFQAGSRIYDIGCSTGTSLELIGRRLKESAHFIGIDNSSAMINRAREKLESLPRIHKLELICDDVQNITIVDASLVIVNYTLQFIPIPARKLLLKEIFKGLREGGLVFISEKVSSSCCEFQETTTKIYEAFKRAHGYSRSEIERKKEALENVLVPLTEEYQRQLIRQAGFSHCESVIKWNNFVSLVAIKR